MALLWHLGLRKCPAFDVRYSDYSGQVTGCQKAHYVALYNSMGLVYQILSNFVGYNYREVALECS
jgi:hypothetical protein